MPITDAAVRDHAFLKDMFADKYFPKPLVEKGKEILLRLCEAIERDKPADAAAVLVLTHAATEEFNALAEEFGEAGSELETAAREAIGADFAFIIERYGLDVDVEDAMGPRDW